MKQYLRGDLIFSKLPVIGQQQLTLAKFSEILRVRISTFLFHFQSQLRKQVMWMKTSDTTIQMKPFQQSFQMALLIKIPEVWPLK